MKKYSSISLIETLISLAIVGISIVALLPVMTIKKTSTDPYKGNSFFTQTDGTYEVIVKDDKKISIGTEKAPNAVAPLRDRSFIVMASGLGYKDIPPLYVGTKLKFLGQEVNVDGDNLVLTNTNSALTQKPRVEISSGYTGINASKDGDTPANTTILANNDKEYIYVDGNDNVYIGENVRNYGPVSSGNVCGATNDQPCRGNNIIIANFQAAEFKSGIENSILIGRKSSNNYVIEDVPDASGDWMTTIKANLNTPVLNLRGLIVGSDRRLKNIIGAYKKGLYEIEKLKPVEFTYKNDDKQTHHIGVIAQDLKKIFPESVVNDPSTGYLLVNTDEIFYALLNAIKELDAQNKVIEKNNDELETKIAELRKIRDDLKAKKGGSHE